jgi:hypothetical protein
MIGPPPGQGQDPLHGCFENIDPAIGQRRSQPSDHLDLLRIGISVRKLDRVFLDPVESGGASIKGL